MCAFGVLWLLCEAPEAYFIFSFFHFFSFAEASHQTCTFQGPGASNTTKFHEKTAIFFFGRGKKLGSHPSGPHPSGPHFSGFGAPPSRHHPSGPHPSGPHPSGPFFFFGKRRPKTETQIWAKFGLAKVGISPQIHCEILSIVVSSFPRHKHITTGREHTTDKFSKDPS